jgi:hypothetical protein
VLTLLNTENTFFRDLNFKAMKNVNENLFWGPYLDAHRGRKGGGFESYL